MAIENKLQLIAFAVVATLGMTGCSQPFQSTYNPLPTPVTSTSNPAVVAKNVYVQNSGNSPSSLDVYPANLNGTAEPSLRYDVDPTAVAVDSSGSVYVSVSTPSLAKILVFPSGSQVAARTIIVPESNEIQNIVHTMLVDNAGNLYVAFRYVVFVLPASASGTVNPIRIILGPTTTFSDTTEGITEMAIDSKGNLYVAEGDGQKGSKVVRFDPGVTGDVAPVSITSASYYPTGVALDSADNIYLCQGSVYAPVGGGPGTTAAIYEFSAGASAGTAPIRTISGINTKMLITHSLHIDMAGNIFVLTYGTGPTNSLVVFSANAAGDVNPASVVIRSHWVSADSQFALY